jgi:hypothetical protein
MAARAGNALALILPFLLLYSNISAFLFIFHPSIKSFICLNLLINVDSFSNTSSIFDKTCL